MSNWAWLQEVYTDDASDIGVRDFGANRRLRVETFNQLVDFCRKWELLQVGGLRIKRELLSLFQHISVKSNEFFFVSL